MKNIICLLSMALLMSSCSIIAKPVTVPIRLVGAALTIIPVAGNTIHNALDEAADAIEDVF